MKNGEFSLVTRTKMVASEKVPSFSTAEEESRGAPENGQVAQDGQSKGVSDRSKSPHGEIKLVMKCSCSQKIKKSKQGTFLH